MAHVLARWEGDGALKALLRAAATNAVAAARFREIFASQVGPAIAAVAADPKAASLRAGLISTQVLGFALCRYVLEFPPVVALRPADVVKWLGPTVQRYAVGAKPG